MPQLFSQSTLQRRDVQHATFGRLLTGRTEELAQFTVERVGRHANAAFTGNPEDRVPGTSFDVANDELKRADEYERQADYVRIEVVLTSGGRAVDLRALAPPRVTAAAWRPRALRVLADALRALRPTGASTIRLAQN